MTPKDKLIVAEPDATLEQLMQVMRDANIRHIPIVDGDGKLTCITSIRDVIRLLLQDSKQKVTHLKVKNVKSGELSQIDCGAIFVFIGFKPNSDISRAASGAMRMATS